MTKTLSEKVRYIGKVSHVAEMLNVERTTLYNYMRGVTPPPEHVAVKVDEIYGNLVSFFSRLPHKISAMAAKDFPQGIESEAE